MNNINDTIVDLPTSNLAEVRRISWLGIWGNLLLTAMKFFAGFVGHSSVLIADAANSLSDMVTDIVVLVGSKFWGRPADDDHPHGHAKIETMMSFSEVRNFEKLQTRHLGPSGLTVDVHVRVDENMSVLDSHELTRKINRKLQDENPNIVEVTIHIEPAHRDGEATNFRPT